MEVEEDIHTFGSFGRLVIECRTPAAEAFLERYCATNVPCPLHDESADITGRRRFIDEDETGWDYAAAMIRAAKNNGLTICDDGGLLDSAADHADELAAARKRRVTRRRSQFTVVKGARQE